MRDLLNYGEKIGVDFVKFQPIFNDGYVELNAPHLMLTSDDTVTLIEISRKLETISRPRTNPSGFWKDLAGLNGKSALPPSGCGLGCRQSIAIKGRVGICFWVMDKVSYGDVNSPLEMQNILETRNKFESVKLSCKVAPQCFCTQSLSHVWTKGLR